MDYGGVWVMTGMGYDRFDCTCRFSACDIDSVPGAPLESSRWTWRQRRPGACQLLAWEVNRRS